MLSPSQSLKSREHNPCKGLPGTPSKQNDSNNSSNISTNSSNTTSSCNSDDNNIFACPSAETILEVSLIHKLI